jgi:hypothetical protein
VYHRPFPWSIKGKAGRPFRGLKWFQAHATHLIHRYLGILPLSPVCNPYCKHRADNTSSIALDVVTFCPNQYNSLYPPCSPSGPNAQI